jgi:hypothetical protein
MITIHILFITLHAHYPTMYVNQFTGPAPRAEVFSRSENTGEVVRLIFAERKCDDGFYRALRALSICSANAEMAGRHSLGIRSADSTGPLRGP